jgi:hypothetical protein
LIAQTAGERQKAETELKRLKKLAGRVKAKGQNLYEVVLNQKLAATEASIKAAEKEEEIISEILVVLEEYEDLQPEEPKVYSHAGRFGTFTSASPLFVNPGA